MRGLGESVFDIRPVLFANGLLLLVLAVAMGIPLAADLLAHGTEAPAFAAGLAVTSFFGAALALTGRGRGSFGLGTRQAFLFAASGTMLAALLSALPLVLGSRHLSYTDAVFEAVSGITTTGATVMTGLDQAPAAILLWRALLQWLGGAGLIVAALALLPLLRIGGMQIFRVENSGKDARANPRLPRLAGRLLIVYLGLSVLMAAGLRLAGMTSLEAICHAMSGLSTGGFSTSDRSLGAFSDSARWICAIGMMIGGCNLSLFISRWRGKRWRILGDTQVRWYIATMLGFSLALTFWYWAVDGRHPLSAFQHAGFQSVSIISTTGFRLTDDQGWGGFPQVAIFLMTFIGGCTGSAAGGIKIFRYEVLFAVSRLHVSRMLYPHGVFSVAFNRLRLPEAVLRSVLGFFMLYFACFAALAIGLAAVGVDPLSALSAAASALGNVGRGVGPVIGIAGGYATLPIAAKWLLSLGMLAGRLELVPLLLPFLPGFWKH
jgi:trk system potassium uptake protein TrkH